MTSKSHRHLTQWTSRIYSEVFVPFSNLQERLLPSRAMSILFSPRADWETSIRSSFGSTPHQVAFDEITAEAMPRYDLVVPLNMSALKQTCAIRTCFQQNPIPIPSLESVELCDDKVRFNTNLIERGYTDHIPQMATDLGYPYMLKRRVDEWGRSCHIIRHAADEEELAQCINHPDFFSQQLVTGPTEYATHIVFKEGRIVCAMNIEYQFSNANPIKGRDAPHYHRPCPCYRLDLFAAILKDIAFEGLCCVNYKLLGKRPMILEINPRFGGSLTQYFFTFIRHVS